MHRLKIENNRGGRRDTACTSDVHSPVKEFYILRWGKRERGGGGRGRAFDATFLPRPGTSFSFFSTAPRPSRVPSLTRNVRKCFKTCAVEGEAKRRTIDRETINTNRARGRVCFLEEPLVNNRCDSMATTLPLDTPRKHGYLPIPPAARRHLARCRR